MPDTNQDYLRVLDFGATGDGEHDDTDAIQAAVDSLIEPMNPYGSSASGGPICFSPGKYKITKPIYVSCPNLTLFGRNGPDQRARNTWIHSTHDGPAFILAESISAPLFILKDGDVIKPDGFRMEGILIVGRNYPKTQHCPNSAGIEICRGFKFFEKLSFERVTVSYMAQAWRVIEGEGCPGNKQIGEFSIENCCANWCGQSVVFQDDTSANLFRLVGNDFSHTNVELDEKGRGKYPEAALIRAFQCCIGPMNNFEGSYNALRIRKSDTIWCKQNFFEENKGAFCIKLNDSTQFEIGYNRYYKSETVHKVIITNCTEGHVLDRPALIVNSPGVV